MGRNIRRSLALAVATIVAATSSQLQAQSWNADVDGWHIAGTPFDGCSMSRRLAGEHARFITIQPLNADHYVIFVDPSTWDATPGRTIDLDVTLGGTTQHGVLGSVRALSDRNVLGIMEGSDFLTALVRDHALSIVPAGQTRVEQLQIPLTAAAVASFAECRRFVG